MRDGVVAIEALILRLHLRRGVVHLALFGDLVFLIRDLLAVCGHFHIDLAELQPHALVYGIRSETRGSNRALIAASHSVQLSLLPRLELFELAPRGDHVRMLVREAQQQLIESGLRLADERRGVGTTAGSPGRRTR